LEFEQSIIKGELSYYTGAVKENLIPPKLTPEQIAYTYASEADLLLASINLSAISALSGGDM